jgi:O-antigen/teichoic acid export membrane protein
MSLEAKAVNGVIWNSIAKFSSYGIEFVVGIILARILSPKEFGLIGTITVVIALSEVFINSGFSQALIRKQNCTEKDYSTVFYFNLLVGCFVFALLFLTAGTLSSFFNNHELKPLIQVLGVGLIISSLTLIQRTTLTKRIDFKLQTKINLVASLISGIVSIIMAYSGYGVWSLVIKTLIFRSIESLLLWLLNRWKPILVFSLESFKELFGFGSKLLISSLMDTLLKNANYLVIAKYFSSQDLGFFTRAEMFKNLPSQNVSSILTTVGYPVLATVQDDKVKFKEVFRRMFTTSFYIISILMVGMAGIAKALILTLVGVQWLPSVVLLQMLCVVGIMYPINSMNVNILNVVGRSDLYLKIQFYVQILMVPSIILGVLFGIKVLIIGMIGVSLIGYLLANQESYKVLNYSILEQLKDVSSSLILSIVMGTIIYLYSYFTHFSQLWTLIVQISLGLIIVIFSGEVFKTKEYVFIKRTLLSKLLKA